jgi:hypothetical protein
LSMLTVNQVKHSEPRAAVQLLFFYLARREDPHQIKDYGGGGCHWI